MSILRIWKLISISLFFTLLSFVFPSFSHALTNVSLHQITSSGTQERDAFVNGNNILYTTFGGAEGIDIWGYDRETEIHYPVVERAGSQFITDFEKNIIVYDDYNDQEADPTYDVRMFNIETHVDTLVSGGTATQTSGVTNGKVIVYLEGGACGTLHIYDIKSQTDQVLTSQQACAPIRMDKSMVVWNYGAIYGFDIQRGLLTQISELNQYQESPSIYHDDVVWIDYSQGPYILRMKNLKKGTSEVLYETNTTSISYPSLSNNYVVWGENTSQHVSGVKGIDLRNSEIFEIFPQGSHQNGNISPFIWNNIVVWMAWRTGNGDIYSAQLSR